MAMVGDTKVMLVWTRSLDNSISKYQFRYTDGASGTDSTGWTDIDGSGADTTGHEVTGLTNDTTYTLKVRAVNASGGGAASGVTATPKLAIPEAPANFTATPGDGKVSLSWELPTNASEIGGVQVAHKMKGAADYQPWVELAADATAHTFTGLTNGTEYNFVVRALNGAGRGKVAEVNSTPVAVPSAPTNLTATVGDTQVVLSWTLPTGPGVLTKVQVRHKADTAKSWENWVDLAADATTHTVTGLTNDTAYTFEVRGRERLRRRRGGVRGSHADARARRADQAEHGARRHRGGGAVDAARNTSQINSVELRHKEKEAADTGWSDWSSWRHGGAVPGDGPCKRHHLRVRGPRGERPGTGPVASVEGTPELAKPSAPSGLEATSGDAQVTLTWDLPGKGVVDSIDVRHKKETDKNWGAWTLLAKDATTHTETGLDNGVTYEFEVRATNTAGSSASVNAIAQPKLVAPDAPTNLEATAGNAQVTLNWTLPTNTSFIGKVVVRYREASATKWGTPQLLSRTATSYTVTGLTNGTAYTFQVQVQNNAGEGAATVDATPQPTTAPTSANFTLEVSKPYKTLVASQGERQRVPVHGGGLHRRGIPGKCRW